MSDISVSRMLEIQRELQAKYGEKWGCSPAPDQGIRYLLWAVGEVGELVDILKKRGHGAILGDAAVRADFVTELTDVMMYLGDLMLCYGIEAGELAEAYEAKHRRNMTR
ncbi:MAG: nucleotide pyrophosphohydrolase, partial [Clostridiales bacterium]|nr:nucleotide pyrophosphohydrolase [Clostridiales bacterium]